MAQGLSTGAGQRRAAGGTPARDAGSREYSRAARGGPLNVEWGGGRGARRKGGGELGQALDVAAGVLSPSGQRGRVGDALSDGFEEGDGGVGAGGGVPGGAVEGGAGPHLPAGFAGGQLGFRVEASGGELQPGKPVGRLDREDAPPGVVDLPATVDERCYRKKRVSVDAPRIRRRAVGIRPVLVRLGERGGEGTDELCRAGIVEADAPSGRAEGVRIAVDAPETVVLAFGEVSETDLAVG